MNKCKKGGFHRKQSMKNTVCVFCGSDIKWNATYQAHYTPTTKSWKKAKISPTALTYQQVAKAMYSQEFSYETTTNPSNNPTVFSNDWFVTNTN